MMIEKQRRNDSPMGHFSISSRMIWFLFSGLLLVAQGCALVASREGVPSAATAAIDVISRDMVEGNYEKVYNEAAEEWRKAATPDESKTKLKTLKDKLGNVKSRSFHSATEQRNTSGQLPGHVFIITYQTSFERGEGMETFTLVERGGQWLLATYFVSSNALR